MKRRRHGNGRGEAAPRRRRRGQVIFHYADCAVARRRCLQRLCVCVCVCWLCPCLRSLGSSDATDSREATPCNTAAVSMIDLAAGPTRSPSCTAPCLCPRQLQDALPCPASRFSHRLYTSDQITMRRRRRPGWSWCTLANRSPGSMATLYFRDPDAPHIRARLARGSPSPLQVVGAPGAIVR
ncbi:hypothetical protein FA95DRAFT_872892 [Auriscalpium vulgare]|uniref:Uncharacterized protein n=1 Tax=Auriscalpium vulgare TaxID=40419 RepID=A0ACB8S0L3_9AGAM|nr:hypothetical protein FA95DRAFT_872892 [Auriscalpium vulgare]